jgi:hypothetical protein
MAALFTENNYVDIQTHLAKLDTKITHLCEAQKITTNLLSKQDDERDRQYQEIKALISTTALAQFTRCGETQNVCRKDFVTKEIFYRAMAIVSLGVVGSYGFTSAVLWFVFQHISKG